MSLWDFNSWDYQSSYVYKNLKEFKKTLKRAFYNSKMHSNYQQPFKNNNRRPPGTPPPNGQSYDNQNKPPVVTPPPKNYSKVYDYNYNYQYKYKGADNSQASQYKQQVENVKSQDVRPNETKVDSNVIVKYQKSVAPYYMVGFFWIFYATIFPLYRLSDFIIAIFFSPLIYIISKKVFKAKKIYLKKEESPTTTGDPNIDKIIKNGKEFSKQLREANLGIQQQTISLQISRLEVVCDKITNFIADNPKKAPDIRKFMNYYMPTTLKLLRYYDKLEEQGISGDNINSAMKNIEDAMGNIVMAFEKQLDSLFADEALDISTDISVLEGVLAQEGLMSSDFEKDK